MEIIRTHHRKTREQVKQVLVELLQKNNVASSINWNGFDFEGKAYGTTIKGSIFDDEVYIEVFGWFEAKAARKLREYWKDLVISGIV